MRKHKKTRPKREAHFPSIYFGFLSAFAMVMAFFMFKGIIKIVLSNLYATIISVVIYLGVFYFSYDYSEYDKDLRKSMFYFSIILWVLYLLVTILWV